MRLNRWFDVAWVSAVISVPNGRVACSLAVFREVFVISFVPKRSGC